MRTSRAAHPVVRSRWAFLVAALLLPVFAAMPSMLHLIAPGAGPFNGLQMSIADFRGDGTRQVVAQSDDGSAYVADLASGRVLARFAADDMDCGQACYHFEGVTGPINPPAVADVDGDGRLDVVLANTAAVVARFSFLPESSNDTAFAFTRVWEHRFNQYQSFTTMDAGPVLADLDGRPGLETVIAVEQTGLFAVRPDGTTLWGMPASGSHATPTVADLDGDGRPEIVLGRDDGRVVAMAGTNGATRWTYDASAKVHPASIPAAPSVADITGDGVPEVVFTARDAHDASNYGNDHAMVFALDAQGGLLWTAQPTWMAPLSHTRAIVLPVGGHPAILLGDWNTIGHVPGNFERVGPGHVFLLDGSGTVVWMRALDAGVSDKEPAVADAVGDGSQQVIVPGMRDGRAGLHLFDLATGKPRGFIQAGTATRSGIAVADVRSRGTFGMVVAVEDQGHGSLQVWTAKQKLASAFPGWGARTVPRGSTPVGPPPGPGPDAHDFTASFTPTGNEWWVEAAVASNQPVAAVVATIDGGAPIDLPKTSWGTWAKSVHAVSGSVVQFTARNEAGDVQKSSCYSWVTFDLVDCPGTSGGGSGSGSGTTTPPPAGVSFTVVSPNEWWEQVQVSAQRAVSDVALSVSGGPWQPMTHASWGDWTTSVHAAAGSTVEFRATLPAGAWVSDPFRWMQDNATKSGHPETSETSSTSATTSPDSSSSSVAPTTSESQSPSPSQSGTSTSATATTSASSTATGGDSGSMSATTTSTSSTSTAPTSVTFKTVGCNEWWEQVRVKGPETPSQVDVRIGGGAWSPMKLESWNHWTAALDAPAGSSVLFRATMPSGVWVSEPFTWVPPDNTTVAGHL